MMALIRLLKLHFEVIEDCREVQPLIIGIFIHYSLSEVVFWAFVDGYIKGIESRNEIFRDFSENDVTVICA